MILNPRKLRSILSKSESSNIGPNSYDLQVETVYEILEGIQIFKDGTRHLPPYREVLPEIDEEGREVFRLRKGHLYQVESIEEVSVPEGVAGITIMRSSMHKSGASGEVGLYDTGYSGKCGMTVSVQFDSIVEKGASIFQLVLFEAREDFLYNGFYKNEEWKKTS